jgi:hypothetical protein
MVFFENNQETMKMHTHLITRSMKGHYPTIAGYTLLNLKEKWVSPYQKPYMQYKSDLSMLKMILSKYD